MTLPRATILGVKTFPDKKPLGVLKAPQITLRGRSGTFHDGWTGKMRSVRMQRGQGLGPLVLLLLLGGFAVSATGK